MFEMQGLPDIIFVGEGGRERRLRLSATSPRIRAIAAHLKATVPAGSIVGLMYPSEPDLVINWLAALHAGLRPLVMQYPTRKQSRAYWSDSVRNTVRAVGIAAIIADRYCVELGLQELAAVIGQDQLDTVPDGDAAPTRFDDVSIIQLSSGTTGHRKAIAFTGDDLQRHVADFNATLQLDRRDRIVSWLPLYHDMGYIACFVMPLLLGIDIVMLDPMVWVRDPALLWMAIERHGGTICYMPNFGFEVMARHARPAPPTMRRWISCSEPVAEATAARFLTATGTPAESFVPCYAMAENIFAVTFRNGLQTRRVDNILAVSCGVPIQDVEIKIRDGEIFVRSPTSLTAYLGGDDIRDADGFYPTGDLGEIVDGELYVTGRKQDLLIQAGRKFMLSDIDLTLNRLYPEVRGRAAAISVFDERLGTQMPVMLIESNDFFVRDDQAAVADALKQATGLDQIEAHFVPPHFLTKTSSGKFNRRKSAADWALFRQRRRDAEQLDAVAELRAAFPAVRWDQPVESILDSLSLTVLRVILQDTSLAYDGAASLTEIAAQIGASSAGTAAGEIEGIRIVSIADRSVLNSVTEAHLDAISAALGCPVSLEHVCLPPTPVILSDLIFQDYFAPRLEAERLAEVDRALDKLRGASLILVDDQAEMFFPPLQVYGVLSHNLERDPRADLIAIRWQRYAARHHELPLTVVAGADLPLAHLREIHGALARYLNVPLFRIGTIPALAPLTADWEYQRREGPRSKSSRGALVNPEDLAQALGTWIAERQETVTRRRLPEGPRLAVAGLAHYCSHFVDSARLDRLLARYDRFCLAGQEASVPYISNALTRAGKTFIRVPSFAPEILASRHSEFDCVLICGPQGSYPVHVPVAAVMRNGERWTTLHIDDSDLANIQVWCEYPDAPASGSDWFYQFGMERMAQASLFWKAREEAAMTRHSERNRVRGRDAGRSLALLLPRPPPPAARIAS